MLKSWRVAPFLFLATLPVLQGCGSAQPPAETVEKEQEMFESADYEAQMMGTSDDKKKK